MEKRLSEIVNMVSGELIGDPLKSVKGVAPFDEAMEDQITYAVLPRFLKMMDFSKAGAIIVPKNTNGIEKKNLILVDNPELEFAKVIASFLPKRALTETTISKDAKIGVNFSCGQHTRVFPFSVIGDDVSIGNETQLHSNSVIGNNIIIGDNCIIHPNVTIYDGCRIGNNVIIHAGSVIGSDGFGFVPDGMTYQKIHHIGTVQIDDNVEIGANNTIDRAKFGKTWIKKGVKTDNLVHIAHNVTIGEDTVLVAQVGISGSVTVGKHVIMAGQAGIAGHISIGDHAIIGAKTGVPRSVEKGEVLSGIFAMPHKLWLKVQRTLPFIPEFKKRLSRLEKKVFQEKE